MILLPLLTLADPFDLKTPWASAFAPVASRSTTVHNANELRAAMPRGGTVHLAAGVYDLGTEGLPIWMPTVLEGAGVGKSVILVGSQYKAANAPVPGDDYGLKVFGDTIGLKSLTIRNASRASVRNGIMRGGPTGHLNRRVFLDGVGIEMGNGIALAFDGLEDVLMRDCVVTSTAAGDNPVRIVGARRLQMRGNRFTWRAGRVVVLYAEDSDLVGNAFTLDKSHRSKAESGGLELSFASDLRVWDNQVTTSGSSAVDQNDAEGVMTQMSILGEYQGDGKVVAARGGDLATTMRWGDDPWLAPGFPVTRRKALYVLSGRAAGTWRWASPGSSDGVVHLDSPFATAPAPGDRVSLGTVTAYKLDVRRNRVSGYNVGIELYDGGLDCTVVDNAVTNGGGIFLRSVSIRSNRSPRSTNDHFPLWGVVAKRNAIANLDGRKPAALDVYSTDVGNTGLPRPFHGVFVQDNRIEGRNQEFGGEGPWRDGLLVGWNNTLGPQVAAGRRGGVVASGNAFKNAGIFVDRRRASGVK